jgi:Fur family ferric uptake transcriptional regulator
MILNENYFQLERGDLQYPHEAELQKELSANGFKLTRQRRAVLSVISASGERLDPADVHAKAQLACPCIGLTTVYRTLEILSELGAVKRVHIEDGCHSYALAGAGHRHYVICSRCNGVVEFDGCNLSVVLEHVSARTGFRIESHWLQLSGLCPACQKGEGPRNDQE